MNTTAGSSVLAQPSAAFLLSCHLARSSYVPGSQSSANKTRQEKENWGKKDYLTPSTLIQDKTEDGHRG